MRECELLLETSEDGDDEDEEEAEVSMVVSTP